MSAKTTKNRFLGTADASKPLSYTNDFKYLYNKIRYLAEQWNFSAEQRIENAVTIELQSKFDCFETIAIYANKVVEHSLITSLPRQRRARKT